MLSTFAFYLTLIGSWKKTYVNGKGGKNDPKTKIAVTFSYWRYISEIFRDDRKIISKHNKLNRIIQMSRHVTS